jgi:anti-anti-sigma factor
MLFSMPSRLVREDGDHFAIRASHDSEDYVLEVYGELDLYTAALLESSIGEAENTAAKRILVDLSGVDFMASVGIKVLLDAAARSQRLVVLRAPDHVHRILEQVGLAARLPFDD